MSECTRQRAVAGRESTGETAAAMMALISRLYPICRSLTGDGVRRTLAILGEEIPLSVREVPTGTQVFDWRVPREWNVREAFVRHVASGEKVVDFARSNLHLVGYSVPVRATMSLAELREHLFSLPDHPEWIPYRTSYYQEDWGFCLSHRQLGRMPDGEYEVVIDSTLEDGHLTYGEWFLPGETSDEVLLSCHVCHPSLCNDNLSGMALAVSLAKHLATQPRRYSYRILFIPGTIGSITWLALNEERVPAVRHGLVLAGVGDRGSFTYKRSRRGDAEIDRVFGRVLQESSKDARILDFIPYGYDERQFCSPGFDLPVGCAMRTPFGEYPEYHTSADDLSFVSAEALLDSFRICRSALSLIEDNRTFVNQNPRCEPQLGRRGLYEAIGGQSHTRANQMAILWVLNLSDGDHSLLDIAERSGCSFESVRDAAGILLEHGLLEESRVG